jgi:hypothetical protein
MSNNNKNLIKGSIAFLGIFLILIGTMFELPAIKWSLIGIGFLANLWFGYHVFTDNPTKDDPTASKES